MELVESLLDKVNQFPVCIEVDGMNS
jgi:hypothetical protein